MARRRMRRRWLIELNHLFSVIRFNRKRRRKRKQRLQVCKGRINLEKGRINPFSAPRSYLRRQEKLGGSILLLFSPDSPVTRRPWDRRHSQIFVRFFPVGVLSVVLRG